MKQRKLVIGLLVMLAVAVSGFTFAYWSSGVTGDDDVASGTISIGTGTAVSTTVVIDDLGLADQDLVPTAYTSNPGNSVLNEDYVLLTFSVNWSGNGAEGATSTISIDDITFSGLGSLTDAEIDLMFDVVIESGASLVAGTPSNVVVRVTFAVEPATQAIYNDVATGTLTVGLDFLVADVA